MFITLWRWFLLHVVLTSVPILSVLLGVEAEFWMEPLTISCPPTDLSDPNNFLRENCTLEMAGTTSDKFDTFFLYYSEKEVCRRGNTVVGTCRITHLARLVEIGVQLTDTSVTFSFPEMTAQDSGYYKIKMTRVFNDVFEQDERYTFVKVSREASVSMGPGDGSGLLEKEEVGVTVGDAVSLICSAEGGWPEVTELEWSVTSGNTSSSLGDTGWNVTFQDYQFSLPDELSQRNISQRVTILTNQSGAFTIQCRGNQEYYPASVGDSINLSVNQPPANTEPPEPKGGLNKWTIVIIVLICLFVAATLACVIVSWCTSTICFGDKQGRREKDRTVTVKPAPVVGVHNNGFNNKVEVGYVVGQDFQPNRTEEQFAGTQNNFGAETFEVVRSSPSTGSSNSELVRLEERERRRRKKERRRERQNADGGLYDMDPPGEYRSGGTGGRQPEYFPGEGREYLPGEGREYFPEPALRRTRVVQSLDSGDNDWSRRQIGQSSRQEGSLV